MSNKLVLIDGTYELYRMFYGAPRSQIDGKEVGATRSFVHYLYNLVSNPDITFIGVAFSTIIESFRNDHLKSYKTSARVPPDLFSQFKLAEEATEALGITYWGMIEYEADDAIATVVSQFKDSSELDQIIIYSSDKDFAQCVEGEKVIMYDRQRQITFNEQGVKEKWGVYPHSIPDLLGLVGDKADGIPGIPRWGMKSAATLLSKFNNVENVPQDVENWGLRIRGAEALSQSLIENLREFMLYRYLAVLRTDVPIKPSLEDLMWRGASKSRMIEMDKKIDLSKLIDKIDFWKE